MELQGFKGKRLRGLTLLLAVFGALVLALPAGASAARVLYAGPSHPIDVNRLAKFGGNTLTATFDGTSDSEWATALARTDFDVLIVGEDAEGATLSQATLDSIASYVRGGKPIIITGEGGSDFLNAVFGFTTTTLNSGDNEDLFATLQPGAAGTRFAGGPGTLTDPSATDFLGGTPGTTIYSGPDGTWVFMVPFGAGTVTFLGWDLCGEPDDCGNTSSVEDDWYRVVNSAIQVSGNFTIDSVTRNKKKGTATITAGVQFAGDLIGSGNGARVASAGAVISKAVTPGQAQLVVKATGKKKKKLNRKGKAKVNVTITYTPTGGSPHTQSLAVKLKKKHKKKK